MSFLACWVRFEPGAMILRGQRKLTVEHVPILDARFSVSADLLL